MRESISKVIVAGLAALATAVLLPRRQPQPRRPAPRSGHSRIRLSATARLNNWTLAPALETTRTAV
jgi:hypothetical protein